MVNTDQLSTTCLSNRVATAREHRLPGLLLLTLSGLKSSPSVCVCGSLCQLCGRVEDCVKEHFLHIHRKLCTPLKTGYYCLYLSTYTAAVPVLTHVDRPESS